MNEEFEYAMEREPLKCRIAAIWEDAGKEGLYFGSVVIAGQRWGIVKFNDSDDPDLLKAACLEIAYERWVGLKGR